MGYLDLLEGSEVSFHPLGNGGLSSAVCKGNIRLANLQTSCHFARMFIHSKWTRMNGFQEAEELSSKLVSIMWSANQFQSDIFRIGFIVLAELEFAVSIPSTGRLQVIFRRIRSHNLGH